MIDDNEATFVVPETSAGMRHWLKTLMMQSSFPALLEYNRIMTTTAFRAEVRAIELPVTIIHGDNADTAHIAGGAGAAGSPAA